MLWRLIDQCLYQLLVDKRGKAVLSTQDWPSQWKVGNHYLVFGSGVGRLKNDGMCLVLVSEVLNDAYLISCVQLQFDGFGDIFDSRVQIA